MKRSRSKSVVKAAKAVSVTEPLTKVTKCTRQGVQQPTATDQEPSTSAQRANRPQRRMTAVQALATLQNLLETESGSESDRSDVDDESTLDIRANDSSDSDNNNEIEGSEDLSVNVNDEEKGENGLSSTGKDGTVWKQITKIEGPGRIQQQNVFIAKAGLTNYCRAVSTPLDALRLLIDDGMLRHIKTCTQGFAQLSCPNWNVTDSEL